MVQEFVDEANGIVAICHDIYPARGRKHTNNTAISVNSILAFATIFTPQGDGNKTECAHQVSAAFEFATIFTPQGDGN